MRFEPKTEEQLKEENLWQPGLYGFEILQEVSFGSSDTYETCNRQSKKGNDMIQLIIKVMNSEGDYIIITDYLLEAMAFKLRHAAVACNLEEKYNSGHLDANDFIGKTGMLELKIDKDKTGEYAAKNAVKDYVINETIEDAIDDALPDFN